MQRGRIVVLGNVGINLGDSMYDGTIYVGGKIGSYGSDAIESPMTKSDIDWLKRNLKSLKLAKILMFLKWLKSLRVKNFGIMTL